MALVCPDVWGEILLLQYVTGLAASTDKVLHLFSNDVTPADSTVLGDLTEVTSSGYVPVTLASASWTTTQTGGVTTAVYSIQTFTFSTDAVSYGYYITDTSNRLLWLERYTNGPYTIPADGGNISITNQISLA